MTERASTDFLAIHCSATRPSHNVTAAEVDVWHRDKGWAGIGYNWFIQRGGLIEEGRPRDDQGAHVSGYNDVALGICMAGGVREDDGITAENNFTDEQWKSLDGLVGRMVRCYGSAVVQGHRDFPQVAKECPSFDAIKWAHEQGYPTPNGWESEPTPEKWITTYNGEAGVKEPTPDAPDTMPPGADDEIKIGLQKIIDEAIRLQNLLE